jgi:hypothetical protein
VLACAGVVLALFLFRPGAERLKNRIAWQIGGALQRRVEIGKVHVRLIPRPGFDLEDFVVHDDPAFSAEPVLRAQEVTANLRLLSLLRGHLEVSSLSLNEPSLNLVRNADGHWNLESMLEHARQTAAAPTGGKSSAGRPAFPYIEADQGRINFKLGSEKKPFALTDADYALWQDSESSWGMRLKAQPLRTDLGLSDTGVLRVNGTWQRADSLRNTPVEFTLEWEKAQLGQVTKLLSGQDRGWRGTVHTAATLSGTPADLAIDSQMSLEDFRRYDILAESPLALRTHCTMHYSSVDRGFHQVKCLSPVGDGSVIVAGNIDRILTPSRYHFTVHADKVPMPALLALARHAKRGLPKDLQAAGVLTAQMEFGAEGQATSRTLTFTGNGETEAFRLSSPSNKSALLLDRVPIELASGTSRIRHAAFSRSEPDSPHLLIGPFRLDRAYPLIVQGWVGRQGYSFTVSGESTVQHLLQAAQTIGLPALRRGADGAARVDLQLAGNWAGFPAAHITGSAQLKSVRLEVRGLSGPVEVAAAALTLRPDRVDVHNISASAAGSHWTGTLSMRRPCSGLPNCAITFALQADQISTDRINKFVNPTSRRPWYRFLTPDTNPAPPLITRLNASGKLSTSQLLIHTFTASHVVANISAQNGLLRISDLRGDAFGGRHHGHWDVDFNAKPARYSGEGDFRNVILAQLASAMHNEWISGIASANYQVQSSGSTISDLLQAASGKLEFEMSDGVLRRVMIDNSPLRVRKFTGNLVLRAGEFSLDDAHLEAPATAYAVSGTASWSRNLDFKLLGEHNSSLNITGTLEAPRVSIAHSPATEAALKH